MVLNGIRQEGPGRLKRRPLPGEIVIDRTGREFVVHTCGMKFVIPVEGPWLPLTDIRIKEPEAKPVEVPTLTPEEEFLG